MIRLTLMDGSICEITRSDARGLVPFAHVFSSPLLRAPIEGIVCHGSTPLPLLGPLPSASDLEAGIENRPWILLFEDHAQVIRGMPDFGDSQGNVVNIEEALPRPKLKSA